MQAHIVVGLGYGDEGKGSWVDHLVRAHDIKQIVRFNGGAQAAHHVVTDDGRLHRFAQFGSGMFVPGTQTLLSRFMLIDPQFLLEEAEELAGKGVEMPLSRMIVSENAPVITPFNRLLNRIMEIWRHGGRHGSCGYGIGITQGDVESLGDEALYIRDLGSDGLRAKLSRLWERRLAESDQFASDETRALRDELAWIDLDEYAALFRRFYSSVRVVDEQEFRKLICSRDTVFEGAQGVLLDQDFGFFPHVTRSKCTFENALTLLQEAGFTGKVERIGLMRAYGSRHGEGPFVTEDPDLKVPPCHNGTNPWQGRMRTGWFDGVAARYALEVVGGVDTLAITSIDRLEGLGCLKVATAYEGSDQRFFRTDGERIFVPQAVDRALLTERSSTLKDVIPRYQTVEGFEIGDIKGRERYLDLLEAVCGHPITAFSASAGHRKIYR